MMAARQPQLAFRIPAPRTSLIGRERDAAEVRDLLVHGRERLLTLTGMGGCGKTRLAFEVASAVRDHFPDGVLLLEIARITDPLLLPQAAAFALGVTEPLGDAPVARVMASLQSRALLIVMDNCEHLIDACAGLADSLLHSCDELRILATSREPLQITGERRWRVPPLGLPVNGQAASAETLASWPAVQLFVERAATVDPGFRLTPENADAVARICTLVGGLPLGIELAAAWTNVLSAAQILCRLADCSRLLAGHNRSMPARHQTLDATIDWSYRLLSLPAQAMFRMVSVFAGGWGLEAAEAICAGDWPPPTDVLAVLRELVDKSLVLVDEQEREPRYRLLEPVRQYAQQLLVNSEEHEATRARHVAYYIALVKRAEPELHRFGQAAWLRRLDYELENIRAALNWAEARGDTESLLRLAGAMPWYFWMRRKLREGQSWIATALRQCPAAPPKLRAKALYGQAMLYQLEGNSPMGLAVGRSALALYREAGDAKGLALTTAMLSHLTMAQGDLAEARSLADDALAHGAKCGSRWLVHGLIASSQVLSKLGETAAAIERHQRALAIFRELGDGWGISYQLTNLAAVQQDRTDLVRAAAACSVRYYWEQGDHHALPAVLEYLASKAEAGTTDWQVRLFAAAVRLRQSLGIPEPAGDGDDLERCLAAAKDILGETRFTIAWAEGCAMSLEQAVASALEEGRSGVSPHPVRALCSVAGSDNALTRRQTEVARLIVRGLSDREIAGKLCITEGTARLHVHHILRSLGLRSRFQVADWALSRRYAMGDHTNDLTAGPASAGGRSTFASSPL